jgi:hypothetical protein
MPAYAGIQFLDSGFRQNDNASVGVLNPIENKIHCNACKYQQYALQLLTKNNLSIDLITLLIYVILY